MKNLLLILSFLCLTQVAYSQDPVVTNVMVIKTTMGDIGAEFYGVDAPKTVANFVGLAEQGFFNGILFHRVVKNFVIQTGDPLTKDSTLKDLWGTGGESIYGEQFEDELNPAAPSYKRGYIEGVIAMANAGPNTNSSQFFIGFGSAKSLPKKYTIFGKVFFGMDIVHAIEQVPVDSKNRPITPVKILAVQRMIIESVEDSSGDEIEELELK